MDDQEVKKQYRVLSTTYQQVVLERRINELAKEGYEVIFSDVNKVILRLQKPPQYFLPPGEDL